MKETDQATILIVEDNVIVAQDIRSRIEQLNYAVSACVTSGEAAVQSAMDHPPDLILMDIKLKGRMSGIDAYTAICDEIKVPVIYLTSYSDEDTLAKAKLTGPAGYIVKPFEDEDLKTGITIALHQFKLAEELKESQQQYHGVVNTIQDSVVVVGEDQCVKFVNQAFCRMYQYTADEAIGLYAPDLIHSDFHPVFERFMDELKKDGVFSGRTIDIRKDGSTFYTDVSGASIQFSGKACFLAVIRDITEQIQAEEALIAERNKLKKALAEINQLSGLLPICGHCKKIRDDKGYWNQIDEYIQNHADVTFSHGVCQECAKKYYPNIDIYDD